MNPLKSLRYFLNSYFPLPISLRGRTIKFGSSIFRYDGAEWSEIGIHDANNFLKLDHSSLALLFRIKNVSLSSDSILDICCGPGRHLNHLANSGYTSLYGFDIMRPSIANAVNYFPSLHNADLRLGNIVDILPSFPNSSIDWAITHSATLENIHPSFPTHKYLFDIVNKGCVFLLHPTGHLYPRNYKFLYESAGFYTASIEVIPSSKNYSFHLITWVKPSYLNDLLVQ